MMPSQTTRSPGARSRTFAPTSATEPLHSWPGMHGYRTQRGESWPCSTSRSVRQIPALWLRTRTSSGPHLGVSTSRSAISCGRSITIARIRPSLGLPDKGPGEVARVERAQIFKALADADQLHGHAQLVRDRDGDAALCRPVELRQRDAGHVNRLPEEPCLLQAVLTGGRVDHEQRLVRGAFEPLADHAANLCELLHQVGLGVQPP